MAIRAALIFNNHGKPRLTRFYSQLPTSRQQALLQRTFALVHKRTSQGTTSTGREVCNFLDAPELRPLLPPPAMRSAATTSAATAAATEYDATYDEVASDRKLAAAAPSTSRRKDGGSSSNVDNDQLRVIYRHYATLYFVFIVDESESELGILDLIQVFVEALDRSFENVCELDLIFHFDQVHAILDEIIQGGLVLETNIGDIAQAAQAAAQARKASAVSTGGAPNGSGANGNAGALGALGWTPVGGLGGLPWGDAAANVGGWARDLGARIGGGGASAAGGASARLRY